MKRTYNKQENITNTTFDFTHRKFSIKFNDKETGKAPYKRCDKSITLINLYCIFFFYCDMYKLNIIQNEF